MDTSETYIKMCEKATEIRANHEYVEGDIVAYLRSKNYQKFSWASEGKPQIELYVEGHIFDITKIEFCWLPRQDQLQEMVPTKIAGTKPNLKMISEFTHFFDYWDTMGIPAILTTWEQLWLAFVMKEKYNKAWNGEDWIVGLLKR